MLVGGFSGKHLQRLESQPHDAYCDFIISEFLFGPTFSAENPEKNGATMLDHMRKVERFERLSQWSAENWQQLLQKYFICNCRVALLGLPSKETATKLQDQEKERLHA